MPEKEATARIKINRLLEAAGWRFFDGTNGPANIPPLETQRAIVAEIEAEQAPVNANRDLIARMETKIQATLARVWGEEKDVGGGTEKPEPPELMIAEAAAGYGKKSTTG